MKNKIFFIVFFIAFNFSVIKTYSQEISISGYVYDSSTEQPVAGCLIFEAGGKKAVSSDSKGYFSISFNKNEYVNLQVSYIGYDTQKHTYFTQNDTIIIILLTPNNSIEEITVLSQSKQNTGNKISINSGQIKLLPTLGGEADLIKILQLTPGVQQGREGSSDILVRGGSPDQNLILLDNVPLYYINHLGGFVSVFNPDIIEEVTLIKGGFPAYYGGRLSSVIDIKTIEGNSDKYTGSASIGMLSAKLFLQGPIIKDKLTFSVSGRRFMYDLITIPISKLMFDNYSFGYTFYDVNIKLNYKINPKTKLDLSYYGGNDNMKFLYKDNKFEGSEKLNWGNYAYSLRFNKELSKNVVLKTLVSNSDYHYSQNETYEDNTFNSLNETKCEINDINFKINTDINVNQNVLIQTGYEAIYHDFKPGTSSYYYEISDTITDNRTYNNFNSTAFEQAIFFQSKIKFLNILHIDAGARFSNFIGEDSSFYGIEPRFIFSALLNKIEINATYSNMNQYIHLLSGSGVLMPTDFWVPSYKDVIPEKSTQYTLGFDKLKIKKVDISTVIYYKTFKNLIDYKEGVSTINGLNDWKKIIDKNGTGYSYGFELLMKYNSKKIESWVSYTYSRTFRQFDEQNLGEKFIYKYDKPHNFIITAIYKASKKYSFSASWTFASGLPMTLATNIYNAPVDFEEGILDFADAELYTPKNSYRMKPYHRLDLSLNRTKQKKHGIAILNLSIYNVYNRFNSNYYYYGREHHIVNGNSVYSDTKLLSMSFFPIMPSISYSFVF
ncbi:MAG: TonB-dependent receptor [Bacteroidales bacterium]|nr:TonB-dependent receptor [Bacteroidales bacterium]